MGQADLARQPSQCQTASRKTRIVWLSCLAGGLLCIIVARFWLVPSAASLSFGVPHPAPGPELHHIIALRDLGLGVLAIAFAMLREWRALAIWLFTFAGICFGDAGIVINASGPAIQTAFHVASGVFCLAVGRGAWAVRRVTP